MAKRNGAKLFRIGGSQAVRFPNTRDWFAELDRLNTAPFMENGRAQPLCSPRQRPFVGRLGKRMKAKRSQA